MINFTLALQAVTKKTLQVSNQESISYSVFMWIAVVELVIILLLVYKLVSKKNKLALSNLERDSLKSAKSTKIDMDSLMNNINSSRALYKELSRKCHPDRFMNDPKQKLAEEIFQEISKYERNFDKLSLIKIRAIKELSITV